MSRRRRKRMRTPAGTMMVWQRGDGRTFSFSRRRTMPKWQTAGHRLAQQGRHFLLVLGLLGVCGLYMASGYMLMPH